MSLQLCYYASKDAFPLPLQIKERYGPFGFPESHNPDRPYISSNFVVGLQRSLHHNSHKRNLRSPVACPCNRDRVREGLGAKIREVSSPAPSSSPASVHR